MRIWKIIYCAAERLHIYTDVAKRKCYRRVYVINHDDRVFIKRII
jgi:hypothetical protein